MKYFEYTKHLSLGNQGNTIINDKFLTWKQRGAFKLCLVPCEVGDVDDPAFQCHSTGISLPGLQACMLKNIGVKALAGNESEFIQFGVKD